MSNAGVEAVATRGDDESMVEKGRDCCDWHENDKEGSDKDDEEDDDAKEEDAAEQKIG